MSLEQPLYTVMEGDGPLNVCAQIVEGSPSRPVNFTLRVFQGPGTAEGESGILSWYITFNLLGYQLAPSLEQTRMKSKYTTIVNMCLFTCSVYIHEPQMVLTLLGSQLT